MRIDPGSSSVLPSPALEAIRAPRAADGGLGHGDHHRVAAETVALGDEQDVAGLQLGQGLEQSQPLVEGRGPAHPLVGEGPDDRALPHEDYEVGQESESGIDVMYLMIVRSALIEDLDAQRTEG
jgi:hypothetical protein